MTLLFALALLIIFLTSVAAWVNTKIILEDLAEIKVILKAPGGEEAAAEEEGITG